MPPAYKTNGFVEKKFALKAGWTCLHRSPYFGQLVCVQMAPRRCLHLGVILLEIQVQTARAPAMQRRRPLNDTIPEIRWMKEEERERERRGEGETVGKIFIWDIGRSVGRGRFGRQVPPKQHHQVSILRMAPERFHQRQNIYPRLRTFKKPDISTYPT